MIHDTVLLGEISLTELKFYIMGSSGESSDDSPITVVRRNETIPILSRLIPQPLAKEHLTTEMQKLVPHLLKIGVLKEEDSLLSLGFPCFTQNDYQLMNNSLETTALRVVDALKEDWSEISEIVDGIAKSSHTLFEENLYNILGCVLLDWLSLGWLSEKGIAFYDKDQPDGSKYLLQGVTKEAHQSSFSRFCYSTTAGTGEWRFTVFGQANDKRWITPELQMHQTASIRKNLAAPEPLPAVSASFSEIANFHFLAHVADVLASGDASRNKIQELFNLNENESRAIERYLIESRIINVTDDSVWVPRSMILTLHDKDPIEELFHLTKHKIVDAVVSEKENLFKEYEGTTSQKHNVPFEEAMTDLWHDIFSRSIKVFLAENLMKTMDTDGQASFSSFIWNNDVIDFTI